MENVKTYVSSNGLKKIYKVTYRKYHVVTIPRFIFLLLSFLVPVQMPNGLSYIFPGKMGQVPIYLILDTDDR